MATALPGRGVEWSVVIPTLSGWPRLCESLPPLLASLGDDDEVIIVGDGCDIILEEPWAYRCRVVINRGRRGFAPTCNCGAKNAAGRTLLFLNDDLIIGADIRPALGQALAQPGVAVVGPNIESENLGRSESGTELLIHHGVFEARQGPLSGVGLAEVPYVCGAALAISRDLFVRLGGFDERLAPYFWEDVDLCLRARREGKSLVCTETIVRHRHGATIGAEPEAKRREIYERNRLLLTWRHLIGLQWLGHLGWAPIRVLASLVGDRTVLRGTHAAWRRRRGEE